MKVVLGRTIVLLIFIHLISCSNTKTNPDLPPYVGAVDIKILEGDSVLNNSPEYLGRPYLEAIIGDYMIFTDMYDHQMFSVASISGDSLVGRFGVVGEGPGQLLGVSRFQTTSDGEIYIYDSVRQTIYCEKGIPKSSMALDTAAAVRFKDMSGGWLYKTANGYVGDNLYGDGSLFTYYDDNGNAVEQFGLVPGTKKQETANPDFYMAYQVKFAVSPDLKYMCAGGAYHDWLAFFDVSGDKPRLIKEYYTSAPIVESKGNNNQFHLKRLPETKKYYSEIVPFKGGVYLIYRGKEMCKMENGDTTFYILKYGWDGEINGVYAANEETSSIRVTPGGETFYATSYADAYPEIKIFKYNLSEKKRNEGND